MMPSYVLSLALNLGFSASLAARFKRDARALSGRIASLEPLFQSEIYRMRAIELREMLTYFPEPELKAQILKYARLGVRRERHRV